MPPAGVDEKAKVTISFLQRKVKEYEEMKLEIVQLQDEAEQFD